MMYIFELPSRQFAVASVLALAACATSAAAQERTGPCRFSAASLDFEGTPAQQAACLLQKVERGGRLREQRLPQPLRRLLDEGGAPSSAMAGRAMTEFPEPYRSWAMERTALPASRTAGDAPLAYFVIHDTSMPFLGIRPFPRDLNHDPEINDLNAYVRPEPVAHLFVSRAGQIWPGHDLAEPWRATKLETRVAGTPSRGRFVHVELVQPRRYAPGSTSLADTLAPRPGFSAAQYRLLAALYVHASARAGRWLIPAFHATIDAGIPDAHDDPQNFDLRSFAGELDRLLSADKTRP